MSRFPHTPADSHPAEAEGILDLAVEGIIVIDGHGIIETFNRAAQRMFAYESHEALGRRINLLMPEPFASQHDKYIQDYLRTGKAKIIGIGRESIGLRRDGTTFPIELSVSEVRIGSRRTFTGIVRDITERKRLEKEVLEISEREQRRIGQDLHDGVHGVSRPCDRREAGDGTRPERRNPRALPHPA